MPTLALLSPKVWLEIGIAALLVALAWYGYNWVYDRGANSVQSKWDTEKLEQAQQSASALSAALQVTKDLQTSADKDKESKNAQIKNLNASLNTALIGLSNRPSRPDPSGVPGNTSTGGGCTGANLFKPDAEFLAREAARADTLQVELQLCYDRYRKARDAIK